MLGKPHILSLFPNSFNKFNNTLALMEDPLFIVMCVRKQWWLGGMRESQIIYKPSPSSDKPDDILKVSDPTPGIRGNIDQILLLLDIWMASDIASKVRKDSEYFSLLDLMAV